MRCSITWLCLCSLAIVPCSTASPASFGTGLESISVAAAIHEIQGAGSTSPLVGQVVTTTGVVTGRMTSAFFIQTTDVDVDADPLTSEGIFVFTSASPPAAAAVGNLVSVTGTVQEFIPSGDPSSPPQTRIVSPTLTLISTGNPLPAAATLTAVDPDPAGSIEQLERLEGMRVHVDALTVIAPTQGIVNEANASATSNGVFHGVVAGITRPFREPGVAVPDPLPAGSPCCIPRFDANPECLRVDSDGQSGAAALEVTSGATVTGLTGPLDYSNRGYTIVPDPLPPPAVSGNGVAVPVSAPGPDEFTVGSFSLNRFYDAFDDPNVSDVVLTQTAFDNRLRKASLAIRDMMRTPDLIGIEEMENLTTLQAVAQKTNDDAVAAGDPNPNYAAYLLDGNDVGGIDVGFLVKSSRVTVADLTQEGKNATYLNPNTGTQEVLNDRPPLVLRATILPPTGAPFPVTAIVVHQRVMSGIDSSTPEGSGVQGDRVRAKRRAQAEFLANLVQARQAGEPNESIIVVGDYSAFEFNDGYVDVVGTSKGTPAPPDNVVLASSDVVNPDLINLVGLAPAGERYSLVDSRGNAHALDHMLITGNLIGRFSALRHSRMAADFPESFRNDPARAERITGHDPLVAYFVFPTSTGVPVSVAGFALHRVTPNPSGGEMVVSLSLPSGRPAELQVIDIAGRVVTSRAVGSLGAGAHRVSLGRPGRLAAGIYLVRLRQDGSWATARAVVLR